MRRSPSLLVALSLLPLSLLPLSLVLVGCSRDSERPNLLLITIDTLRSDHTSLHGYHRPTTPKLEAIASQGARFDLAYSASASTGPSHATLFSGLYPPSHRVIKNGVPLAARHETLAEILSARGYQTAGFVSSFVLDQKFGLSQGFQIWDDEFLPGKATMHPELWEGIPAPETFDRRAEVTTDAAIDWLTGQRDPERPFHLFVHYFDPHAPYLPPGDFGLLYTSSEEAPGRLHHYVRLYDAEITYTDSQLGRLVDALDRAGLGDDTLVVITSDHGEGLMDHDFPLHSVYIYEEAVRVPLVVRWPGRVAAGRTLSEPVAMVDLMPTILDLMGIRQPSDGATGHSLAGRSLAAALRGDGHLDPHRPVFLYRRHYRSQSFSNVQVEGEEFGVREGRWKYIEGPDSGKRELFDLERDPGELANRFEDEPEVARQLSDRITAWRQQQPEGAPIPAVESKDRSALEALGYVE